MNKAKIFLLSFIFMFSTIIFQIFIIAHLNTLEIKLDKKLIQKNKQNIVLADDSLNENFTTENKEKNINNNDNITTNNTVDSAETSSENKEDDISEIPLSYDMKLDDNEALLDASLFENCLFIGDSRTESFEKFTLVSNYCDFAAKSGLVVSDLETETFNIKGKDMTYLEAVSMYKYKKIFIGIGYNELGWDYEDVLIDKYSLMIDNIKSVSPDTEIIVQSILHVAVNSNVYSESENNDRINLYNEKFMQMCIDKNVTYVDLNPYFSRADGYLFDDCASDGIHLNAEKCVNYIHILAHIS